MGGWAFYWLNVCDYHLDYLTRTFFVANAADREYTASKVPVAVDEPCEATFGCAAVVKPFGLGVSGISCSSDLRRLHRRT